MTKQLLNNKYTVELEVLSPLHIGAGSEKDWITGVDFVEDQGKIYILNHKKLLRKISVDELSGYLINKNAQGLKRKISGNLKDVSDIHFDKPVSTDNDIKTFIKNGLSNKPIVPGSSIKGAIRSILLKEFLKGSKPNRIDERDYFGSSTAGDEFMRFIKISDAQFNKTELVNTKVFNLHKVGNELKGGWKHEFRGGTSSQFKPTGFNTIYEIILPGEEGELTIALSERGVNNFEYEEYYDREFSKAGNIFNSAKKEKEIKRINKLKSTVKDKKLIISNINKLFEIINNHTKEYIKKQIDFFKKYSNNETPNIIENLKKIQNQIPTDNSSCVLKMSAGSGFHSITGDWQFDDFSINQIDGQNRNRGKLNGKPSAKSRKIAIDNGNFYMMGFVKLSILSDELISQREKERLEKIEEKRKKEAERIAKEKTEQKRIEVEKRAKIEAEQRAEQERLAEEIAEQTARELFLKQLEEEEKQRQEANKQKIKQGLSYLNNINNYNSGKNLISKIKKQQGGIPAGDIHYIESFVKKYFNSADKEWSNLKRGKRWKEIKGWVGQETAKKWFEELQL